VFNGTAGADLLHGYAGNDSYLVNNRCDIVTEGAGAGVDLVRTSLAKYNLTANVENLTHLGTDDFVGSGNLLNNKMLGGSGADEFHGGTGHDTLVGGTGSDLLFGDDSGDVLFGNAGYDRLHGGDGSDRLSGGNDSDRLYGENGNDTLSGGNGLDQLFGGAGSDSFVFDTAPRAGNVDAIHDFNAAADTIRLDDVVFDDIHATGQLAAGAFAHWQDPGQANDRILYDQSNGKLYYDPTGGTHADAQQFATLTNSPDDLSAKDFLII
jgi:Ca2+-binding RTX toxin-like protein